MSGQRPDQPAGDGGRRRRGALGDAQPGLRGGRARRDALRGDPRLLPALPRRAGRRVQRLDAAGGARLAVRRGPRHGRPLAVQEFPRAVGCAVRTMGSALVRTAHPTQPFS
ncbi:hypothetical protein OF001_U40125 [Pseudomonas sp. OF001]|nr:hypothetical protein OF001_U40125 [Pseudomonas sp. OF001]